MNSINVDEIMETIRKEIKEKGYNADMISFKDVSVQKLQNYEFNPDAFYNAVLFLDTNKYIPWKQEKLGKSIKGIFKKIVQKLIGFVIAPISDTQNVYNQQVAAAFLHLLGFIEEQSTLLEEYDKRIENLEKTLKSLEK